MDIGVLIKALIVFFDRMISLNNLHNSKHT